MDDVDGKADAKPEYGRTLPIAAAPLGEITILYPVAQLRMLVKCSKVKQDARAAKDPTHASTVPLFSDISTSEILNVLKLRLW